MIQNRSYFRRVTLTILALEASACVTNSPAPPTKPSAPMACFDIDGPEQQGWGELQFILLTDGIACWYHDGGDVFGGACGRWTRVSDTIEVRPCSGQASLEWPVAPVYLHKKGVAGTLEPTGVLSMTTLSDISGAPTVQTWRATRACRLQKFFYPEPKGCAG
jgi:hypothetical protein